MYPVTIMDSIYPEGMLCKFGKAVSRAELRGQLTKQETKPIHGQNMKGTKVCRSFFFFFLFKEKSFEILKAQCGNSKLDSSYPPPLSSSV